MAFLGSGTNPAAFFQTGSPFPGSNQFYNALKYNFGQEYGPQGQWAGNLARSNAMDQGAAGYYSAPAGGDPGSGAAQANAQGAFGNLLQAKAAAENAAAMANAQTKSTAGQGILNVANAYGNDIYSNLEADQALKNAQAATSTNVMGDVMGGIQTAGGIGSEIVAPGNPMGFSMIANGAGTLMNNGHSSGGGGGGMGGFGSLFSGMGGEGGGDGATGTMAQNGASGFTSSNPGAFSQSSLPSWINPDDISAYSTSTGVSPLSPEGVSAAASPGMFGNFGSMLSGWF